MTDWMISDDKIILRGLIQLSPESSETCGVKVLRSLHDSCSSQMNN